MLESFTLWSLVAGVLLVVMALGGTVVKRLPVSTSLIYLGMGIALGAPAIGLIDLDPVRDAGVVERVTEVAVLVSLFTAGLKMRVAWSDDRWLLPIRLAIVSMTITVALIAVAGVVGLGLSLGAPILRGGILAPTDPVLASDVQVTDPSDRDRLRFGLTGEAGLNDGTAFPFVMLGLGLLHRHELGGGLWRWITIDVLWAALSGIGIGVALGTVVGRLVLWLRHRHQEAVGTDDFLALGLIALAYGTTLAAQGYGFLAVFAAGAALRRIEQQATGHVERPAAVVEQAAAASDGRDPATAPESAPAALTEAVLGFNEQLERIGEVAVVLLIGGLLWTVDIPIAALWFVPMLFFGIRPLAVWVGLTRAEINPHQRHLVSWFGIRGIGSVYYLMFATAHGLPDDLARTLAGITLTTLVASAVVHGFSVTPLMSRYNLVREREARGRREPVGV